MLANSNRLSRTPSEAVEASIETLTRLEPHLRAFVAHDPVLARAEAAVARGPLSGLTIGIKDIIDTAAYPTRHGSEIYADNWTTADAACVMLLRQAGAVSLGKTHTTEFAFFRPGPTVNPFDPARTPGGSSSGSAAAVAAGGVDFALASQTAASLTRPASFCGVVGFKPSFGRYGLAGIKGLAPSFDTLGVIAGSVGDAAAADAVLSRPVASEPVLSPRRPGRIGVCRTPWWEQGDADMRAALDAAGALLGAHTEIVPIDLAAFTEGAELHRLIMSFEAAQALAWEAAEHDALLSEPIRALIATGCGIGFDSYRQALRQAERLRARIDAVFDQVDVLMAPAAVGVAPVGLEATGDPIFSRLWTLLHLPSVTLPGMIGTARLPIGTQFLGRLGEDQLLLDHCVWIEGVMPRLPRPRLHASIGAGG